MFREGTRVRGRGILIVAARRDTGPTRIGLSVGRRYGGAVARNRIKRRLREAFRHDHACLPDGLDLVVVPRTELGRTGFEDLRHLLTDGAKRALRLLELAERKKRNARPDSVAGKAP